MDKIQERDHDHIEFIRMKLDRLAQVAKAVGKDLDT